VRRLILGYNRLMRKMHSRPAADKPITGILRVRPRGVGVVETPRGRLNISVADQGQALHGDLVRLARTSPRQARVEEVLTRATRVMVGQARSAHGGLVMTPDDLKYPLAVAFDSPLALAGQRVAVRVLEIQGHDLPRAAQGELVEVLDENDPATPLRAVAYQAGLPMEHTPETIAEATRFARQPWGDMRDDTGETIITIDGEDAKDLDDAVRVERTARGYAAWVYIADVSWYARHGTAIDQAARERGTSAYLPGLTLHMLPDELCQDVCSLHPGVKRRTLCAHMSFDAQGRMKSCKVNPTVIVSKARLTYGQVNCVLDGVETLETPVQETVEAAAELAQLIEDLRRRRGALDFDFPEGEVRIEAGVPVGLFVRERGRAERLIESLMIAANEGVAEWLREEGRAIPYRIHEQPDAEKLEEFGLLARKYGLKGGKITRNSLPSVLERLSEHPCGMPLAMQLLRALPRAVYSPENRGHFGLGSKCYCHFTSPIRRYPDLLVHRAIWAVWAGEPPTDDMGELCREASACERRASAAERQAYDICAAKVLSGQLGDVFAAVVISASPAGLFARLDCGAEVLVPTEQLPRGYEYDHESMAFIARNGRLALGAQLEVQLHAADVLTGRVSAGIARMTPKRRRRETKSD